MNTAVCRDEKREPSLSKCLFCAVAPAQCEYKARIRRVTMVMALGAVIIIGNALFVMMG